MVWVGSGLVGFGAEIWVGTGFQKVIHVQLCLSQYGLLKIFYPLGRSLLLHLGSGVLRSQGQIPLRYPASEPDRELVCDLPASWIA